MPLYLQNTYGGWLGSEIVNDFTEYARVVFSRWGGKVKYWFTVNEPIVFCGFYPLPEHYFKATSIPPKQQQYVCGHNVLLSHASAYHLAKSMHPDILVSYKTNGGYKIPLTNSSADAQAVQRAWDFYEGWFANPTFINGDYPESVKQYTSSFLPEFTDEQKRSINRTCDIFAHDAYTSNFVMAPDAGIEGCLANKTNPLYPSCYNSSTTYSAQDGGWNIGYAGDPGTSWLHKATEWVPALLHYIQDTWKPDHGIAVSEFGFTEPYEQYKTVRADILFDLARTSYYHDYMEGILIALSEGVKVVGTLAWSIVDNLEWSQGYTVKFGIQVSMIDFSHR
jgi:beta-glucosidase/6-phospho-beta-glucosidase/beta-galactosidase